MKPGGNRVRVKICCIADPDEARMAIGYGADAIGLVGKMPGGPGVIDDPKIMEIAAGVPPPVATFLLTSEITADGIVSHYMRTRTSTIQIVDYVADAEYLKIRKHLPWVKLVQVVHVEDESAVERALRTEKYVDCILLDSGSPNGSTKILGGTGKTHDWRISREIVERLDKPVFLAGGINPENVADAIDAVHPFAIDMCSGVRTDGRLDGKKLRRIFDCPKIRG